MVPLRKIKGIIVDELLAMVDKERVHDGPGVLTWETRDVEEPSVHMNIGEGKRREPVHVLVPFTPKT
jgi:hypothetical protein